MPSSRATVTTACVHLPPGWRKYGIFAPGTAWRISRFVASRLALITAGG